VRHRDHGNEKEQKEDDDLSVVQALFVVPKDAVLRELGVCVLPQSVRRERDSCVSLSGFLRGGGEGRRRFLRNDDIS
jgi:hypothetical protein